jgi:hypothetical protein
MSQARQLPLFTDTSIAFRGRSVKSVTFKGNFDYPIHRWFRLTPSFSPELVIDIYTFAVLLARFAIKPILMKDSRKIFHRR